MTYLIPIAAIAAALLATARAIVATLARASAEPDNLTKYH